MWVCVDGVCIDLVEFFVMWLMWDSGLVVVVWIEWEGMFYMNDVMILEWFSLVLGIICVCCLIGLESVVEFVISLYVGVDECVVVFFCLWFFIGLLWVVVLLLDFVFLF